MDKIKGKLVSVVLPVHNTGLMLIECMRSLRKNTKVKTEIIIIESESTDGTAGLCDLFGLLDNVTVFHTPKNGLITAINHGIRESTGDYILLTQADVIFPKLYNRDWLQTLCRIADEPKCGIATSANGGGVSGPEFLKGLAWCGTWCMLLPRSTISKVGIFDENFNPGIGDDIDYSYRAYKEGLNIYASDFTVDHHRENEHFNDTEQLKIDHAKLFKEKHNI